MRKKINYTRVFFLVALCIYVSFNIGMILYENHIESQLDLCDVNKDGSLTFEELAIKDCNTWFEKSTNDIARTFAPFTLIPISMFIGLAVVLVGKFVNRLKQTKVDP